MEQEEKSRVCAYCKKPFTKELPLSKQDTSSDLACCKLNDGESSIDCIDRYVASMGGGVYPDARKKQWTLDQVVYFSVQRFYHQDCACSAQKERTAQLWEKSCEQIKPLLQLVGFHDAVVVPAVLSSTLVKIHAKSLVGDGSKLFRLEQMGCLRAVTLLGNFFIIFASDDAHPFIDLSEVDVKSHDVYQCLARSLSYVPSGGATKDVSAKALLLRRGSHSPYSISLDSENLLLLMALRQKLSERQQVKA